MSEREEYIKKSLMLEVIVILKTTKMTYINVLPCCSQMIKEKCKLQIYICYNVDNNHNTVVNWILH